LLKRNYLQVFLAVQKALFLRELNMRISVSKFGLFWTFFQPFVQVILFVLVKLFLFGDSAETFDFAVFLAINFTAFHMFKSIINKSLGAFKANRGLFNYKQVKPIDTIIARSVVEIFITAIILLIFIAIGYYFNFDMNAKDVVMIFIGFIWLIIFSIAFAILMALANTFFPSVSKINGFLMYAFLFGSALFYSVDMLSPELQKIIYYNPLAHFMELLHGSYFYTLDLKHVDFTYMMYWTVGLLFAGLWLYMKLERKIISL
jgi:capsular polysaccharide transport system permease protein